MFHFNSKQASRGYCSRGPSLVTLFRSAPGPSPASPASLLLHSHSSTMRRRMQNRPNPGCRGTQGRPSPSRTRQAVLTQTFASRRAFGRAALSTPVAQSPCISAPTSVLPSAHPVPPSPPPCHSVPHSLRASSPVRHAQKPTDNGRRCCWPCSARVLLRRGSSDAVQRRHLARIAGWGARKHGGGLRRRRSARVQEVLRWGMHMGTDADRDAPRRQREGMGLRVAQPGAMTKRAGRICGEEAHTCTYITSHRSVGRRRDACTTYAVSRICTSQRRRQ